MRGGKYVRSAGDEAPTHDPHALRLGSTVLPTEYLYSVHTIQYAARVAPVQYSVLRGSYVLLLWSIVMLIHIA